MARALYLDCFSGISGDMVLGAFLDAGLPFDALRDALGSLALPALDISAARVLRAGVSATHFRVAGDTPAVAPHAHPHTDPSAAHGATAAHHTVAEVQERIDGARLSPAAKARAQAMFLRLAEAEAAIHAMPVSQVHLHEVGAVDSIIDVVGAVFALEWAGIDEVVCSPLNVGGGTVRTAHGVFPVPAPATIALLGSAPVYSNHLQSELVTPTGALLATSFADRFGPVPPMRIARVGYGAGTRNHPSTPNVLRILIGDLIAGENAPMTTARTADAAADGVGVGVDAVVVLTCAIDDMNPEFYAPLGETLMAAGALDTYLTPVQMKKGRPGIELTVVAPPAVREALCRLLLRHSTSLGVRVTPAERRVLDRLLVPVETGYGTVRVKVGRAEGVVQTVAPEFEDCLAVARRHDLAVKDVHAAALQAYAAAGHPLSGSRSHE